MPTTNIILPEHNSSRLLFIANQDPTMNLEIEDLDQDPSEKDGCNCDDPKFLLGKLNNYIWLLEDTGKYDTNHTHNAVIKYTDQFNNTETFFNVKRIMEWSEECDRLYTAHGGGLKFILLDSPEEDQTVELFIKYERSLPGFEKITNFIDNNTGITYTGCLAFYKYNSNNIPQVYQVVQLFNGLDVRDNNTLQPMENINYCSIHIKNVLIDFNKLQFTYSIEQNNTNDVKIGFIGTGSLFTNPSSGNYGKFISSNYYINNDNFIEPGVFLVQAPQNRSWICYRSIYNSSSFNPGQYIHLIYGSNTTTYSEEYGLKTKNNCNCFNINRAALNGYNGTLENGNYIYEININKNDGNIFLLMLPKMFTDYESLEYLDENGNTVSGYMDLGANEFRVEDIYNELDGLFYKLIVIPVLRSYCKVNKIKLTYHKG